MPPVRWKLFCVSTLMTLVLTAADSQEGQDAISMSADGWRPIIGTSRRQPSFETESRIQEITQYKNPSKNFELDIVKAETPIFPTATPVTPKFPLKLQEPIDTVNNINGGSFHKQGNKIPPHSKFTSPGLYHTIPAGIHGPHIPVTISQGRPAQFGQILKRPQSKPTTSSSQNVKRKPIRGQAAAHSTREEIFAHPPNTGQFVLKNSNNLKTRETQGLGLLSPSHFSINGPSSHTEFASRFAFPSSSDSLPHFKNYPVTFIFSKPPQQTNDIHYQFKSQNDEYTRNLVPPPSPPRFSQEKEKYKITKLTSKIQDIVPVTEPIIKLNNFGLKQSNVQQFPVKAATLQENVVAQLPPPFEQSFAFQKQFTKPQQQAVDVQVTKEKLKVFHGNAPVNFNPSVVDYTDYDIHTIKQPAQLPKLQTYEVTEGKWADDPNPFTFRFNPQGQQIIPQRIRKPPTAKPLLITAEPLVELNVPPFLPTPYKPQGVVPTSPTQSEVSTIFSQISMKMNKYKNQALATNPLFFDVKEVSTHYPILGRPEPISDSTKSPLPMDATGEISNEVTTLKLPPQQIGIESNVGKVPQRGKTRRRKPQPRKPTTTTTSTTEEPSFTESYELQKTQENYEEVSSETEPPLKKRRPRPPNRHRINTGVTESEERPSRYRTTPAIEDGESTEVVTRGRHRYRHRGNKGKDEIRNSPVGLIRKRIRPTTTEMPANHKITETDLSMMSDEATEVEMEQSQSIERESQGLFETKYPQDNSQSFEDVSNSKSRRTEYELPGRHYEPTPYEEENVAKYETTVINNEVSAKRPNYELDEEVTDRMQLYDRTRTPIRTNTEEDATVNIQLPENEIDYSTSQPTLQENDGDIEQSTITTSLPTTTISSTTEMTTKSHRIRGRPSKYDSSNRPRFSVKEYRLRLNQYTSTTPSSTTDFVRNPTESGVRLRFPNRIRTRPTSSSTTTQPHIQNEEDDSEAGIRRGGFKPKEPRHSTPTTENPNANIITEKNIKSINTRLRPFGRHRSTTEPTSTTAKMSIRPNLFSARRRPPQLSLRTRIHNKIKNTTEETTTVGNDEDNTEPATAEVETERDNITVETNTEFISDKMIKTVETTTEPTESTTAKLDDDEYSQRVSELTSSFKNEYDTPGLFKSVSPTSRRIPNYFTISTDDPILPIEAFFPNIKDKDKD